MHMVASNALERRGSFTASQQNASNSIWCDTCIELVRVALSYIELSCIRLQCREGGKKAREERVIGSTAVSMVVTSKGVE